MGENFLLEQLKKLRYEELLKEKYRQQRQQELLKEQMRERRQQEILQEKVREQRRQEILQEKMREQRRQENNFRQYGSSLDLDSRRNRSPQSKSPQYFNRKPTTLKSRMKKMQRRLRSFM